MENIAVTQAINGERAELLGLEMAWQQNFTFLPGLLGGLGIYANYTYTQSTAEVEDFAQGENLSEIDLPGQSDYDFEIPKSFLIRAFTLK